jgi:hypothetical protein
MEAVADKPEPRPVVQLSEMDGNAYAIIGAVVKALRRAGASERHVDAFVHEAMASDYDGLLQAAMRYAVVE